MNQETLDIIYAFISEDYLDQDFIEVGSSTYQGVIPPEGNDIIYNTYDGCIVHLHECLFSLICVYLPFNDFEMGVLNHLVIDHSQLHPMSHAYIKVL